MLLIDLPGSDPHFNLAVDEYLLRERKEDFLVLYANSPSVIIGKHQVAHRETDTGFVTRNNIPVIRRISGGGTVFHDPGNLNFSFIVQSSQGRQVDFRKYTAPVIEFLSTLGVAAAFEGKNDLKVNGLKISGNAEHVYRERVLHHGTLLFNSDLGQLKGSLRKDRSHYNTRGVDSNPSSVANLCDLIPGRLNINEFRKEMSGFFLTEKHLSATGLTAEETTSITRLAETKYSDWEWNYAYGPEYLFNNKFETPGGVVCIKLYVRDGIIQECELKGQHISDKLSQKFIGHKHMPEDIRVILAENKSISESEILSFF